jgi:neutral ceramidase
MRRIGVLGAGIAAAGISAAVLAAPANAAGWAAGGAKVEITPPAEGLKGTDIIHDSTFVRAIWFSDGKTCGALVAADLGSMENDIAEEATKRIVAAQHCPRENLVISATHTHSPGTPFGARNPVLTEKFINAIVRSVADAAAHPRPVSIHYSAGTVDLNSNRDLLDGQNRWTQAPNPGGASDKTVAVIDFRGADGVPVGVYMTYAMHPINWFMTGVVSADFPGVATRYVEDMFNGVPVAVFAQGASGNQNPRMLEEPYVTSVMVGLGETLRKGASGTLPIPPTAPNGTMMPYQGITNWPVPDKDLATWRKAVESNGRLVDAEGSIIGETVVDLIRNERGEGEAAALWGGVAETTCPGRDRTDTANPARENALPPYADGVDVKLKIGVLRLGSIDVASLNGEAYTEIGQELKARASHTRTMLVTLANGRANSGYIYSDNAARNLSFQVIGSRLKPGCAQATIVNTALKLMAQADAAK